MSGEVRAHIRESLARAHGNKLTHGISRTLVLFCFLGGMLYFVGNAPVLWQHRRTLDVYIQSINVAAGCRCEVICFQLPVLWRREASVQLIMSAPQPPVFRKHYHNAPESHCCRAITPSCLISPGRASWGGNGFFVFLNSTEINIGGNVSSELFTLMNCIFTNLAQWWTITAAFKAYLIKQLVDRD